ncbi:MAG: enoyl-CoA hydratase/isomerase family protein [Chloroflexi bacterium]|nr:enoyl-CoA hydratase/isomerase family protein [Chloroflexota bacterium]
MAYKYVTLSKDGHVGTLTFNRPEKLNAFHPPMMEEITLALQEARADDDIRVLVVTGKGRGFCAGPDIQPHELSSGKVKADNAHAMQNVIGGINAGKLLNPVGNVPLTLQRMEKITIAMVNGPAAGAGADFALGCDMRFGSPKTSLLMAHMQLGIPVDTGGTWFLPRLVGIAKAMEIIMGPELVRGEEAFRLGLLNRLFPEDKLEEETMAYARRLAQGSPVAQRLAKLQIYTGLGVSLETALAQAFADAGLAMQTADFREAITAFAEKRQPQYKGR